MDFFPAKASGEDGNDGGKNGGGEKVGLGIISEN
jgi:hypothetical protein